MLLKNVQEYIKKINTEGYGGYSDWRLPTLEEAMSLVERTTKNGKLFIDPMFDNKQETIWTTDEEASPAIMWAVIFSYGFCLFNFVSDEGHYVRAVRSGIVEV